MTSSSNTPSYRQFLELSYQQLEKRNLTARTITDPSEAEARHRGDLEAEPLVKAVMVCFSDIEGRLHILDYDKRFFLESLHNLTFDGSSIRGLSQLHESDLRLVVDWTSFTWLPADVFGAGKVVVFANVCNRDLTPYESDFRGQLQAYTRKLYENDGTTAYMAPELEGFLLDGIDAEQTYEAAEGFTLVSSGGYFHSLPLDRLREFIDTAAETQRAMGFRNEKDHPEVAPSQFEINFSYTDVVRACDQILLYKLICRQVAAKMGLTATFLPKPIQGMNGNGMHTNVSLARNGQNLFYDERGRDGLSRTGWQFIDNILQHASELCLVFNSSVNAYRRLDPNFEAPNQIKVSANDRGSMIRIPLANERTARIEIRSVAPDTNPYLALLAILKTGLSESTNLPTVSYNKDTAAILPTTISEAIEQFEQSELMGELLGESGKTKYLEQKRTIRDRSPRGLGTAIKNDEIVFHHEVTNQYLWNKF